MKESSVKKKKITSYQLTMKSVSALAVLLFVCVFALVQVWAAPIEEASMADSSVGPDVSAKQALKDWYAAYEQYVQHYGQQYARRSLL